MLLVEYPWLLSQGMKTSISNNIVGGADSDHLNLPRYCGHKTAVKFII